MPRLKDVEQFEKVYKEVESKYQRGEKALKADYESLQKVRKILVDEKRHIRFGDWNAFDIEVPVVADRGSGLLFWPLGSGMSFFRISDPIPIFLRTQFGSIFLLKILFVLPLKKIISNFVKFCATKN